MKQIKMLLIILLAIFIAACSNNEVNEPETPEHTRVEGRAGEALIWQVSSETATVYLVGTIHVGLENLYPMQQVLLDAFYRSDALAVELDTVSFERNFQDQMRMVEMMVFDDGTTVEDHVSAETFEMLELRLADMSALERHAVSVMRVGAIAMTLMQVQLDEWGFMDVPGVDHFFLDLAHEIGKEIIEVETMEFQIGLIVGFSSALQELQLREVLETPAEEALELMNTMFNLWLTGDAEGLRELLDESNREFANEEPELFEEYNTAMMLNRDIAMTELVIEMLSGNQTIFFAVGAAHIVGENGVIEQLEAQGWTVTRVQ